MVTLSEVKTRICLPRHVAHLYRSCAVCFEKVWWWWTRRKTRGATSTMREESTSMIDLLEYTIRIIQIASS
jgi:hypothetical protein